MATDAFSIDWSSFPGKLHVIPPWGLISRVLSVMYSRKVWEMILVALVWKAQAWYPLLLQMLVKEPQSQDMIQSVCLISLPNIIPHLAMWTISGVDVRAVTFQSQLQTLCYPPEGINHQSRITHPSEGGLAGVMSKNPFLDLFSM